MTNENLNNEARIGLSSLNVGLGTPDLYWHQDADHGYECPDDAAIVGNMPIGTEFKLTAAWYQTKKFKVVKVADDVSDDIDVIEVPNVEVSGRPHLDTILARDLQVELDSRGMFVARLESMQANGHAWLTIAAVLALLNDCDMLAQRSNV